MAKEERKAEYEWKKDQERKEQLYRILEDYHERAWAMRGRIDQQMNENALLALKQVYQVMLQQGANPNAYFQGITFYYEYLSRYVDIRKVVSEGEYFIACDMLMEFIHTQVFYRSEIYYNIIRMLEPLIVEE